MNGCGEPIRLFVHHSTAKVTCATSRKLAGTPLDQIIPHLKGFTDLLFDNPDMMPLMRMLPSAVPHTAAMKTYAEKLLSRGIKVVDFSVPITVYPSKYMKKCMVLCIPIISRHPTESLVTRTECVNAKFVANPVFPIYNDSQLPLAKTGLHNHNL